MSSTVESHFFGPSGLRKPRPASVSSIGFHSQRRRLTYSSQPSCGDSVDTFNGDMSRRSEKEILQALNDRFACYIDKVRSLEMHNRNLEEEAAALRQCQSGRTSVGENYERELNDLRGLMRQLSKEKGHTTVEYQRLEEDIQQVRARLEEEARSREELDAAARAMKKYVDEYQLARMELDRKLCALDDEAAFLKKNHEEEMAEFLAQIHGAEVTFDLRDSPKVDVTGALREIRAQLDRHATSNATQAEDWFKVRLERLTDAARSNQHAIRGTQEEIVEYRRQLQSRTIELETLRGTKESLERQRMESEDRHRDDLDSLEDTISHLDSELKNTKWEMASQLKDYQDLLNVKMALDIEIAAYRKLLEGEESRLVPGGPYSYFDSRISAHLKVKEDKVIVQEQTDETQVTEVTEEAEEEEEGEENKEEEEFKKEEGNKGEEKEKEKREEAGEQEEIPKLPEEVANSPQPKSRPKSPESQSPPAKSPMAKSPAKSPKSKSPPNKSPRSKSPPPKTPEPPEKEKVKPAPASEDDTKGEKKDKPESVKDEKRDPSVQEEKVKQPGKEENKEKEAENKKEKDDKPDVKKDGQTTEVPKKEETPKPAKAGENKAPASKPKEEAPPPVEEKPSAPKLAKTEPAKKQEEKPTAKVESEKPEEKKETSQGAADEGKTKKVAKSPGTESKDSTEKAKN